MTDHFSLLFINNKKTDDTALQFRNKYMNLLETSDGSPGISIINLLEENCDESLFRIVWPISQWCST